MRNIYNALLLLIADATQKELARQVTYLKIENRILRSKLPARVPVTTAEKSRLVRFGQKLGRAMKALRAKVKPWREDREMASDIAHARAVVEAGTLAEIVGV